MVAFKPITLSAAFLAISSSAALAAPADYERPTASQFAAELAKRGGDYNDYDYEGGEDNHWGGPASLGFWVPAVFDKWGWGGNGGYRSNHGSDHGSEYGSDHGSYHSDHDHHSEYHSEYDEDINENWDENENENLNNNANNNVNNNVNNNQNDNVNVNKMIEDLLNRNSIFDEVSESPSYGRQSYKCIKRRDGGLMLSKRSFDEHIAPHLAKRWDTGAESTPDAYGTSAYGSDVYASDGAYSAGSGSDGYSSGGYSSGSGRRARYRRPAHGRHHMHTDVVNQNTNTNANDLSATLQNQEQATINAQNALAGFEDDDFYGQYTAGDAAGNSYEKRSYGSNSASTSGKKTCYVSNNGVESGCGADEESTEIRNANQNANENALNAQFQSATNINVGGAAGDSPSQYVKRGRGGRGGRGDRFDDYFRRFSRFDEKWTNNQDYNELFNNNANNNENNNVENNKNENILVTKVQSEQTDINTIEEAHEQEYVDCYFGKGQGQSQGQFYRK